MQTDRITGHAALVGLLLLAIPNRVVYEPRRTVLRHVQITIIQSVNITNLPLVIRKRPVSDHIVHGFLRKPTEKCMTSVSAGIHCVFASLLRV